jgi:hypothetical protein
MEAVIERFWTPKMSIFGDALGGHHRASLELHLEDMIERALRCTWRLQSSEFGDTLGCRDGASLEMHLAAVIE